MYPFWAPDGRSIGFFAPTALKRIDLGSATPKTLAVIAAGQGGTWNTDGIIVFAPSSTSGLMRVPATGGAPVEITTRAPQQGGIISHLFCPTAGGPSSA